mmetsp:Transcript_33859/g.78307  ORF Transcript_33859/g.78307 Transcript_33859/m.78307 type:complete len:214 (-) Transcript_33859:609-1250(-)
MGLVEDDGVHASEVVHTLSHELLKQDLFSHVEDLSVLPHLSMASDMASNRETYFGILLISCGPFLCHPLGQGDSGHFARLGADDALGSIPTALLGQVLWKLRGLPTPCGTLHHQVLVLRKQAVDIHPRSQGRQSSSQPVHFSLQLEDLRSNDLLPLAGVLVHARVIGIILLKAQKLPEARTSSLIETLKLVLQLLDFACHHISFGHFLLPGTF